MSRIRIFSVLVLCIGLVCSAVFQANAASTGLTNKQSQLSFTKIVSSANFSCALTSDGGVQCWGNNEYGQLGNGTNLRSSSPVYVSGLTSGITDLAVGSQHVCARTDISHVKCWGENASGQLGDGTKNNSNIPVDVTGLNSKVISLTAGAEHTCAITAEGNALCWGSNLYGQSGNNANSVNLTPVLITDLSSQVAAITAGSYHTCALLNGGGVKCWGYNSNGQLGDGTYQQSKTPVQVTGLAGGINAVEAGGNTTCALTSLGGVKCWGWNIFGQLGNNSTTDSTTPSEVTGLTGGVSDLSASGFHTCAVDNGKAKCWGNNNTGQLGNGTTTNQKTPVEVMGLPDGIVSLSTGGASTCALTGSGAIKCWGDNSSGYLGNGSLIQSTVPLSVSNLPDNPISLNSGNHKTCVLTSSGAVYCWGSLDMGTLSNGSLFTTVPTAIPGLESGITALVSGADFSCVLTSAGSVKCWGGNYYGQLGNGTNTNSNSLVDVMDLSSGVTALAAGYSHACAALNSGGVKCWGWNNYYQLGNNSSSNSNVPVNVAGLSSKITAVTAGYDHTCTLTENGGVRCWGNNNFGELGDGSNTNRQTAVNVSGLSAGVTAITAGYHHTCALTNDGKVKCWGSNDGKSGDGATENNNTPVDVTGLDQGVTSLAAGYTRTCALLNSGGVKCWGMNTDGFLGDGTLTKHLIPVDVKGLSQGVVAISAGSEHVCAMLSGGRVKCWGTNDFGQLGQGNSIYGMQTTPIDVESNGPQISINYPDGKPGSFFTITGANFPANSPVSIKANGKVLSQTINTNEAGEFIFFLSTPSDFAEGEYTLTVSVESSADIAAGLLSFDEDTSASAVFTLSASAPLRVQEGGGDTAQIETGIDPTPRPTVQPTARPTVIHTIVPTTRPPATPTQASLYLPVVTR